MTDLGLALTVLVLVAGIVAYVRGRHRRESAHPRLSDEHVRRIERGESVRYEVDEPLDQDAIDRAEREFWADEQWDEAEEL